MHDKSDKSVRASFIWEKVFNLWLAPSLQRPCAVHQRTDLWFLCEDRWQLLQHRRSHDSQKNSKGSCLWEWHIRREQGFDPGPKRHTQRWREGKTSATGKLWFGTGARAEQGTHVVRAKDSQRSSSWKLNKPVWWLQSHRIDVKV